MEPPTTFTSWFAEQKKKSTLFIINVIGPHAGEEMKEIYQRKQSDVANVGYTLWTVNINGRNYLSDKKQDLGFVWGATPDEALQMCLEASNLGQEVYILFVCTDGKGKEGVPTKKAFKASHFWTDSIENKTVLPELLSPVSGNMTAATGAYKFDQLIVFDQLSTIDLSKFGMWRGGTNYYPIKTTLGVGNVCARVLPDGAVKTGKEMGTYIRSVQAVARLAAPFCVYLHSEERLLEKQKPKEKAKGKAKGKRKKAEDDDEESVTTTTQSPPSKEKKSKGKK